MNRLLFLCCCLYALSVNAQFLQKGMGYEFSTHAAAAINHSPNVQIPLERHDVWGSEMGLEWQTYGKKYWHQWCKYPRFGVLVNYHRFSNYTLLGETISVLPYVSANILQRKKWRLFLRAGLGLGLATRPFHINKNPNNKMMGAYLNNNTIFRFGAAFKFSERLEGLVGFNFSHFSNAFSTIPNLGLNVAGGYIGIQYWPKPLNTKEIIRKDTLPKRKKWILATLTGGIGYRESSTTNGPKYPVYWGSIGAGLFTGRINRIETGIEYEYVGYVHAFLRHQEQYTTQYSFQNSTRLTAYVANEILVGHIGIHLLLGVYLTSYESQVGRLFQRLSLRYYFRDAYQHRLVPHVGISLKAHTGLAEYFSFTCGWTF